MRNAFGNGEAVGVEVVIADVGLGWRYVQTCWARNSNRVGTSGESGEVVGAIGSRDSGPDRVPVLDELNGGSINRRIACVEGAVVVGIKKHEVPNRSRGCR